MLVCPRCDAEGTDEERFCARCGMPLTFPDVEIQPVNVCPSCEIARGSPK